MIYGELQYQLWIYIEELITKYKLKNCIIDV